MNNNKNMFMLIEEINYYENILTGAYYKLHDEEAYIILEKLKYKLKEIVEARYKDE